MNTDAGPQYIIMQGAYWYGGSLWFYPFAPAPPLPDGQGQKTVEDLIVELTRKIDEHKHNLQQQKAFLNILLSIREHQSELANHQDTDKPETKVPESRNKQPENDPVPTVATNAQKVKRKKKQKKSKVDSPVIDPVPPTQQVNKEEHDVWIQPKNTFKPIQVPDSAKILMTAFEQPETKTTQSNTGQRASNSSAISTPSTKTTAHKKKRLKKQATQKEEWETEAEEKMRALQELYSTIPDLLPYEPLTGAPSSMYVLLDHDEARRQFIHQYLRPMAHDLHHLLRLIKQKRLLANSTRYPQHFFLELPHNPEVLPLQIEEVKRVYPIDSTRPGERWRQQMEQSINMLLNLGIYEWDDRQIAKLANQKAIKDASNSPTVLHIVHKKGIVYSCASK